MRPALRVGAGLLAAAGVVGVLYLTAVGFIVTVYGLADESGTPDGGLAVFGVLVFLVCGLASVLVWMLARFSARGEFRRPTIRTFLLVAPALLLLAGAVLLLRF